MLTDSLSRVWIFGKSCYDACSLRVLKKKSRSSATSQAVSNICTRTTTSNGSVSIVSTARSLRSLKADQSLILFQNQSLSWQLLRSWWFHSWPVLGSTTKSKPVSFGKRILFRIIMVRNCCRWKTWSFWSIFTSSYPRKRERPRLRTAPESSINSNLQGWKRLCRRSRQLHLKI